MDLKSVQLLGSAYKEKVGYIFSFPFHCELRENTLIINTSIIQVQPDMDELTENAEDIAEEGEKKEEVKLGRLQYKVIRFIRISEYFILKYVECAIGI